MCFTNGDESRKLCGSHFNEQKKACLVHCLLLGLGFEDGANQRKKNINKLIKSLYRDCRM